MRGTVVDIRYISFQERYFTLGNIVALSQENYFVTLTVRLKNSHHTHVSCAFTHC